MVNDTSRSPTGIVNVSPAVTGFAVTVPDQPNAPALTSDHTEKWV